MLQKFLIGYLCIINFIAFIITIYDKVSAKNGKQRVAEKTLFLIAFLGGAPLMYITMLLIRHKTKHLSFMILLPLIIFFEIVIILWSTVYGK